MKEEKERNTDAEQVARTDGTDSSETQALQSTYTFTIAAVNSAGQRGPNTTVIAMTSAPESMIIVQKLHINFAKSCCRYPFA